MPTTITSTDIQFVHLADVKGHLNVTAGRDDAEIDLMRGAAEDAVQGLVGAVLHRTVTETVRGRIVVLRHRPVLSVTSVTKADATLATGYTLNATDGFVSGLPAYGDLTVVYVTGRTVVPDAIVLATLIIAGHLWQTQQGASPSMLQGEEFIPAPGLGYAIPNRARDLLGPYLPPPLVA